MKSLKDISVIIPCHDNTDTLPWILKAINAANLSNLEVICVDDQSTTVRIKQIADSYGVKYIRLPEDKPGRRAMARNYGHKVSNGNITLYLDGDIIPEPRLFSYCVRVHQNDDIAVKYPVYSITQQIQNDYFPTLLDWIICHKIKLFGPLVTKHVGIDTRPLPKRLRGVPTKLWVLCASHCTSFPKEVVEEVGGWDESFNGWGEEDLELAFRLYKKGIRFFYPHRKFAAAYHLDHTIDWENNCNSLKKNILKFRAKHPDSWKGRKGILRMFIDENELSHSLVGEW